MVIFLRKSHISYKAPFQAELAELNKCPVHYEFFFDISLIKYVWLYNIY